jgi:hypothetical protein
MPDAPSAFAVMRAVSTMQQARERLVALCPDIEGDEQLYSDMLEGESGDAIEILERLVEASIEADTMAQAARQRLDDLLLRHTRWERRRDALRTVALDALCALTLKRLVRPAWTISLRQQQPPLLIDEAVLPDQWWRSGKREPKRAEIRAALGDGQVIDGAQLGNPGIGISVKTK